MSKDSGELCAEHAYAIGHTLCGLSELEAGLYPQPLRTVYEYIFVATAICAWWRLLATAR